MVLPIGRLNTVDIRKVWPFETDFTKWLIKKENIQLLSDEIGIDIVSDEGDLSVGDFFADIVGKEEGTDRIIVIENQFGRTDHDHLGKLLTYASGKMASIVIWISEDVRDEHRSAIEWLNEHSDENTNFFLVKMEVLQIGNSPVAPRLRLVASPDNWSKDLKSKTKGDVSELKLLQKTFWEGFREYMTDNKTFLSLRTPRPQHWYDLSLGSSEAHIGLTVNTIKKEIGCELYISNNKELFDFLETHQNKIESELGEKLKWLRLPNRKASSVKISKKLDIKLKDTWIEGFEWFKEKTESFHRVFGPLIKDFPDS
ncbi:MAG TPA: DUF4268 domain-containing protein [Ignavibacteria bacterium]|nr:DUF4268 domain-containing protein [Ignavibacteria bacterium]